MSPEATHEHAVRSGPQQKVAPHVSALKNYAGDDRVVWASERREEIAKTPHSTIRFNTGIPSLDELVEGVEGGEMIVVGGKPKNGKTLLLQTLTANFKSQGVNSLFFEYEVPQHQFLRQMPVQVDFQLPRYLKSNKRDWIDLKIAESIQKYDTRAVFVDHLHYLISMERSRNPSLEIGDIVRGLKTMAIKHNVVVFLVSHVQKVPDDEKVTEMHLRDSGLTTAEADTTWIVSRLLDPKTREALNEAMVDVRNHRRTGVMGRSVHLIKKDKLFVPFGDPPTEEEPYEMGMAD